MFGKKIIETVHNDAIFSETNCLIRVYFELTCKHIGKSLRRGCIGYLGPWVKVFRIYPEFRILRLTFQNTELGR